MGILNKSKSYFPKLLAFSLFITMIINSFINIFPSHTVLVTSAGDTEASPMTISKQGRLKGNPTEVQGKHLLLVLVPQLSFEDIPDLLSALPSSVKQDLHFGAMSMRTAGGMNLQNNLLTLSTGKHALGHASWNAYHQEEELQGEQVQDKYAQWAGKSSTAPILHPAIFQLQQYWLKQGLSPVGLGWLGQVLAEQGILAAAFGNSDTLEKKQRLAPTLIMNPDGEAQGTVSEQILSTETYFPTGKKTDWTKLSTKLVSIWKNGGSSLLTIELGDLERLYSQQDKMEVSYAERVRQEWFQEWANWMEEVVNISKEKDLSLEIWTLSPMVSTAAKKQGKMLAPYFTWAAAQELGILTSSTTKQDGIIANLDVLPSICHYFGLEPEHLVGKIIKPSKRDMASPLIQLNQKDGVTLKEQAAVAEDGLAIESWLHHLEYLFIIYKARRNVITTYITIVICLLLLTTGYWWLGRTRKEATQGVRVTIGGILLSPLYFLWLTPLIRWLQDWQWISLLLVLSILTSWVVHVCCRDDALYLAVLGFINTIFILSDLMQGSPQMMRSFLGYDPIVGARFYGIGNEYAGFLLGSSLLTVIAFTVWLNRREVFSRSTGLVYRRIYLACTIIFYTLIVYLLAAPQYGTNLGATLASVGTYTLLLIALFSLGWNLKWILSGLAALALFAAGFLYLHLHNEHTHLGAALGLILEGDVDTFLQIVRRKWEMNMRLIRVSLWGKLFVTSLFVLAVILFRLKRKRKLVNLDLWFQGFRVIVVGSILILLVNDSGIVAAATTMMFVTFPFIYLRFSEQKLSETFSARML